MIMIMVGPLNSITYKHKDNKSDPKVYTNLKKFINEYKENFTKNRLFKQMYKQVCYHHCNKSAQ